MRMLYCSSNRLVRLFNKCSKPIFLELYWSFCTVFYCPCLWTHYKKTTFCKIRVACNNVYWKVLGVSRRATANGMFVSNDISSFGAFGYHKCRLREVFDYVNRRSSIFTILKCLCQKCNRISMEKLPNKYV